MASALYPHTQQTFRRDSTTRRGRALWPLRHIRPYLFADRFADGADLFRDLYQLLRCPRQGAVRVGKPIDIVRPEALVLAI